MQVNLDGVFFMCREALPNMKSQRWGRVITAASSAGLGWVGGSAYSASKSALFGLSRAIAADFGPYGITANCYNPEARGRMGGAADQEVFDGMIRHYEAKGYCTPAGAAYLAGIGGPESVAPWIAYLSSDQAADINGQIFALDARRVALIDPPEEGRVLFRDAVTHGPWAIDELERLAPLVFPLLNPWPRREGEALADWERA
jgi:3-oxoacyl-[acyl-carrier protein] reductase